MRRSLARYLVVLLGCALAATRVIPAVRAWREWHRWAIEDPSVADFYRGDFWVEFTAAGLAMAATYVAYWLLRPREETP